MARLPGNKPVTFDIPDGLRLFSETDRFRTQQRPPEPDPPRFLDRLDSRLDPYPLAYDAYEEQETRRQGKALHPFTRELRD